MPGSIALMKPNSSGKTLFPRCDLEGCFLLLWLAPVNVQFFTNRGVTPTTPARRRRHRKMPRIDASSSSTMWRTGSFRPARGRADWSCSRQPGLPDAARPARRRGPLSGRRAASRLPVAPGCGFPRSRSRSRIRGFPAIGAAGCVPAARAAACGRLARAASARHRGRPRAGAARGEWLELGQEFALRNPRT
jgi:hypothetical protein